MSELSDYVSDDLEKALSGFVENTLYFGRGLVLPFFYRTMMGSVLEEDEGFLQSIVGCIANGAGVATALANTDKPGHVLIAYGSALVLGNLADNAIHYGLSLRTRIRDRKQQVKRMNHDYT